MRPVSLLILGSVLVGARLPETATRTVAVDSCTHATTCERWIAFDGGHARSLVYASYPLDARNTAITRALIMVHGAGRNADHYFETATAAGFVAGALGGAYITGVAGACIKMNVSAPYLIHVIISPSNPR
jgi:hypothetical protein